jgi:hypothetical protein
MWKKYKYCRSPYNKERYDHAKTVSSMKVREAQAPYEKSVALKAKEDPKVSGLEILTTVSLINLGCIESDP